MESLENYQIASLPKDKLDSITALEAKLKSEFGTEVVLIAYQHK